MSGVKVGDWGSKRCTDGTSEMDLLTGFEFKAMGFEPTACLPTKLEIIQALLHVGQGILPRPQLSLARLV